MTDQTVERCRGVRVLKCLGAKQHGGRCEYEQDPRTDMAVADARRAEREKACKAMCPTMCGGRAGLDVVGGPVIFYHLPPFGLQCDASPIRALQDADTKGADRE